MIQIRRLGHATFSTRDVAQQVEYFTRVMGLTTVSSNANHAVLATKLGQEAIVLERGDENRCTRLALQVSPSTDLREVGAKLEECGIQHEARSDITPGIGSAISFLDPKGTCLEIFSDYAFASTDDGEAGIMPHKLGHVAFVTKDVQRVVKFYVEVLGFRASDWRGDFFAFLRCGPDHHTVNFIQGENDAVHHIAFELRDWAEIQRACDSLARKNVRLVLGPIRHIIGHNIAIYHRSPDETLVELFTEIDQMKDEELGYFDPRPWHQDRPQRPKVWGPHTLTNYWGPGRLVSKDK